MGSDRAILRWAEKSGMKRPKVAASNKTSNDKPEIGFGISMLDDGSIRRVLEAIAPIQQRNYVVMEVKAGLIQDERKELYAKWESSCFKRTASVMMGEPPAAFKKRSLELALQTKQEAADIEFKLKQVEERRKKLLENKQKKLER